MEILDRLQVWIVPYILGIGGLTELNAVAGIGIYNQLAVPLNNYTSPMTILVPKPGKGSITAQGLNSKPYNQLNVTLSGVYSVEENLDKKYVFAELPLVQALLEKEENQYIGNSTLS